MDDFIDITIKQQTIVVAIDTMSINLLLMMGRQLNVEKQLKYTLRKIPQNIVTTLKLSLVLPTMLYTQV